VIVLLGCPWCAADVEVDDRYLDEDVRCEECSVAFEFAGDRPARTGQVGEAATAA
jgi:hypothetical protein